MEKGISENENSEFISHALSKYRVYIEKKKITEKSRPFCTKDNALFYYITYR